MEGVVNVVDNLPIQSPLKLALDLTVETNNMYNKIYDFCKVRNLGNIYKNENHRPTPRVQFLIDLLDQESIPYILDKFEFNNTFGYNVIMRGSSTKMVVAHHDIVNPNVDNANDNSASVINAIMVKKLHPETNVVLLDGEESHGIGSTRLSQQINNNEFGKIDWVLNLELTGRGGKYFFIGNYPGPLYDLIKQKFNCPTYNTPYNDSVTFRKYGIDSVVINPLPLLTEGKTSKVFWDNEIYLDDTILYNCHSKHDSLDTIDIDDMKVFVEEVVLKILE